MNYSWKTSDNTLPPVDIARVCNRLYVDPTDGRTYVDNPSSNRQEVVKVYYEDNKIPAVKYVNAEAINEFIIRDWYAYREDMFIGGMITVVGMTAAFDPLIREIVTTVGMASYELVEGDTLIQNEQYFVLADGNYAAYTTDVGTGGGNFVIGNTFTADLVVGTAALTTGLKVGSKHA